MRRCKDWTGVLLLYVLPILCSFLWMAAFFLLVLMLSGCSHTDLTLPDGTHLVRVRFLDNEKIGSVSYDEGSFTMDGYESDMTKALNIIQRLIADNDERQVGP